MSVSPDPDSPAAAGAPSARDEDPDEAAPRPRPAGVATVEGHHFQRPVVSPVRPAVSEEGARG